MSGCKHQTLWPFAAKFLVQLQRLALEHVAQEPLWLALDLQDGSGLVSEMVLETTAWVGTESHFPVGQDDH